MGDRGNIVIEEVDGTPTLYLYTHWTGSDLPTTVANALNRGYERWGDDPYLNRVLFCEMVRGCEEEITGFGIDTDPGDGGTEVYVCHDAKRVRYNGQEFSFEDFAMRFSKED